MANKPINSCKYKKMFPQLGSCSVWRHKTARPLRKLTLHSQKSALKPAPPSTRSALLPSPEPKRTLPTSLSPNLCSRGHSLSRHCEPLIGTDSGLGAGMRRAESIDNSLREFKHRRLETLKAIEERAKRVRLLALLRRKCGAHFPRLEALQLPVHLLVFKAHLKRTEALGKQAAKRMVQWYRHRVIERKVELLQACSHMAAYRIQKQWKRYREAVIEPRKQRQRRIQAAVVIQRHYRGHWAREVYRKRKLLREINHLHFHYQRVRSQLMVEKACVIATSWKAYRARKFKRLKASPDVFKTSSKAPPMRQSIPRPQQLLLAMKLKHTRTETTSPDSVEINTRQRSETDPMETIRTSKGKGLKMLKEELPPEPHTAPVRNTRRSSDRGLTLVRKTTRKDTRELERIVEIS